MNIEIISLNLIKFDSTDRASWPKHNQSIIYIGQNKSDLFKCIYFYQKNKLNINAQYFYVDNFNKEYSYLEKDEYQIMSTGLYKLCVSFTNSVKIFADGDYWLDAGDIKC